ncbi:MAG: [protein-PII] uridylyltransferase [Acidimicrobiia bacterium]
MEPRPGVALFAVGALGRRELCPMSDLDLVIVHDGKSRDIGDLASTIWYPVWDAGLQLDHSVRTVKEAAKVANDDMKAALGLLDARFVAGDEALFDKLVDRVHDGWRSKVRDRLGNLDALVRERHDDAHEVAYALEPDIKNGLGGTRDLTILGVLAQITPVYEPDPALADARETLLEVRVALQRRFGRRERLLLEYQDELAADLGDADADALMARVSAAARTVAWQCDDAWRAVRSWNEGPRGRSAAGRDRDLGPGLVLRDREVAVTAEASPTDDPSLVFRAAAAAAYEGVPIARPTLRRLADECPETVGRWTDATRDGFVSLLGAGAPMVEQVELLDRFGLVTPFLPEWERVRCLPQRNAFHQWTVDRHLLETIAHAADHVRDVHRPDLLLVGALLHDIGKGLPGDHTDNGVDQAVVVATRMGFAPEDVAVLVELVRLHLLLPSVATGRDLGDPATIAAVAQEVGSEGVLELLAALTEADSLATGPTAWSGWKAGLLRRLVDATAAHLGRRPHELEGADEQWALDAARRFTAGLDAEDGFGVIVEPHEHGAVIVAPDATGLLALEVATLGVHGQDVRRARTFTIGSVAVGDFVVEPRLPTETDWDKFRADLAGALADPIAMAARLAERAHRYSTASRPTAARAAEPRVLVDNSSSRATVVEVRAADAIGVLYAITGALASLGVRVEQAYVSTLGHEVVDSFYVTDATGGRIEAPDAVQRISRAVLAALVPTPEH